MKKMVSKCESSGTVTTYVNVQNPDVELVEKIGEQEETGELGGRMVVRGKGGK